MTTAAGQERHHGDGGGGGGGNGNNIGNIGHNGQVKEPANKINKQHTNHGNLISNHQKSTNNIIYNKTNYHQYNHLALKSNYKSHDQYRNDEISMRNVLKEEDYNDNGDSDNHIQATKEDGNQDEVNYQIDDEESLSEALLAVASAEEYAAKIAKLQQACLIPLKEDLADWLNKILKTSTITTENFMDKLDNGVIICRLAKIISLWCAQQLETDNVHSTSNYKLTDVGNHELTPVPRPRLGPFTNGPLRAVSSQSTNCLASAPSSTSLNHHNGYSSRSSQFLDNLIQMHQAKIWDDARGRTFYARDNVCNFIKWSKEFGVNQSVLFESDDLVLHANPRQVVLCLLDVSRIAYVKYGFTEAPGLVKFEQEIDKGLIVSSEDKSGLPVSSSERVTKQTRGQADGGMLKDSIDGKSSLCAKNLRSLSIGDATDELVLRYCKHKKEEAARRRSEQLESIESEKQSYDSSSDIQAVAVSSSQIQDNPQLEGREANRDDLATVSPFSDLIAHNKKSLADTGRIDSLDSGQGPTESASTGHSSQLIEKKSSTSRGLDEENSDEEPKPDTSSNKLGSSVTSQQTSSITNSEISSSRSSLLSNHDGNNVSSSGFGRQITSDLDGKVMRIAKSYYGKGATKDVTRLSEGKYKIADRIVFVRLLKGHRVMVRIGGGWDTLENFLFRHKSDPSQVIDVDNLLPIETKMSFEKSPQKTPTNDKTSKLPYYRRSNSASSTNLSMSNLSISNHSISSNNTPSIKAIGGSSVPAFHRQTSSSVQSSPAHQRRPNQIPQLFIHKNQLFDRRQGTQHYNPSSPNKNGNGTQASHPADSTSFLKRPLYYQHLHKTTPFANKYDQRYPSPLASSRAPASSASNLFPATLTTKLAPSANKMLSGVRSLSSTNNLNNRSKLKSPNKQESFRNFGRSNESLQATSYHTPQLRQILKSNGSTQQAQTGVNGIGMPKPRFLSQNLTKS